MDLTDLENDPDFWKISLDSDSPNHKHQDAAEGKYNVKHFQFFLLLVKIQY
jgi:hypothetical protein